MSDSKKKLLAQLVRLEEYLMGKPWFHDKAKFIGLYLNAAIQKAEKAKLAAQIRLSIRDYDELTAAQRHTIETLIGNTMAYLDSQTLPDPRAIPRDVMLSMSAKLAYKLVIHLSAFVGVQTMKTPASQIFSIRYRMLDGDRELLNLVERLPPSSLSAEFESPRSVSLEVISIPVEASGQRLSAAWHLEHKQDVTTLARSPAIGELIHSAVADAFDDILSGILGNITHKAMQVQSKQDINGITDATEVYDASHRVKLFLVELNCVANDIARATRRGCGNVLLIHPLTWSRIKSFLPAGAFKPPANGGFRGPSSFLEIGMLNQFKVCVTTLVSEGECLVGYKGFVETDAGYFYAPYQTIMSSGIVIKPVSFAPVLAFITRAGHQCDENGIAYYQLVKL